MKNLPNMGSVIRLPTSPSHRCRVHTGRVLIEDREYSVFVFHHQSYYILFSKIIVNVYLGGEWSSEAGAAYHQFCGAIRECTLLSASVYVMLTQLFLCVSYQKVNFSVPSWLRTGMNYSFKIKDNKTLGVTAGLTFITCKLRIFVLKIGWDNLK